MCLYLSLPDLRTIFWSPFPLIGHPFFDVVIEATEFDHWPQTAVLLLNALCQQNLRNFFSRFFLFLDWT